MNVLSLFDGMSCGQIALLEQGFVIDKYYASEIDKAAIKQTNVNFPNAIELGDVTNWRNWDIDWSTINLILAGSPCQGFSFAGKQLAFDDLRSKLFFVFVEILNHCKQFNPDVKFLLENVNMKKDYLRIISEYVGLFPVNINSNLVSAQNRDRWYWTNIRVKKVGLFEELYTDIPQPKDEGILLRDILDKEVDEKYYLKNPKFGFDGMDLDSKRNSMRIGGHLSQTKKHNHDLIKVDIKGNVSQNQDKASCFTAGAHSGGNHSDMDLICVAMRGRNVENPSDRTKGIELEQRLEPNTTGKTNCLSTVSKDNLIVTKNYIQWDGVGFDQDNRAYLEDSKSGTLDVKPNRQKVLQCDYRIRRLTPNECSKLQTIPSWYKWECSDSQTYKMLGNGWTVKVIQHILSYLNGFEKTEVRRQKKLKTLRTNKD